MAAFSIPSNPDFNVSHVEQVKESDYVLNTFVNGYFQTFLQNDRYLDNKIQSLETATDKKIEEAESAQMTDAEMNTEIAKFA